MDLPARTVAIGDIIRRICLKSTTSFNVIKVRLACKYQYGNGQKLGSEGIIHALREAVNSPNIVILAIDASNAFNYQKGNPAIQSVYNSVPELYHT